MRILRRGIPLSGLFLRSLPSPSPPTQTSAGHLISLQGSGVSSPLRLLCAPRSLLLHGRSLLTVLSTPVIHSAVIVFALMEPSDSVAFLPSSDRNRVFGILALCTCLSVSFQASVLLEASSFFSQTSMLLIERTSREVRCGSSRWLGILRMHLCWLVGEGFSVYDHTGQLPRGLTTTLGVNDAISIAPGS